MPRIRILPPALVSRIAAGECIERPASVVKELVENALDAGASRVDIAVEEGGRQLIQVADDGVGMGANDLLLAVTQHATSKLVNDDDLFEIHTLGFRGEALASIGAVARLRLVSCPRDADVGHEVRVEGGEVSGPRPCAAPPGTTVEVRDLFYNVPARRKFLRTNQTETGHITEQLARIALAHPAVAFTLKSNNRVTQRLPATDSRRQRIGDFYGSELADVLLPIERDGTGLRIEGLVAPPAESRGSSKWEYVFVNGRYVRDRFVSHAVKEAYRSLIDPSRYPVVFLFVTIEPTHLDVNVHPTKVEVRWRDSTYVHGQTLAALREKFLSSRLDHELRPQCDDEYRDRVRDAMVEFFTRSPSPRERPLFESTTPRGGPAAQPPDEDGMDARRGAADDADVPRAAPDQPAPPAAYRRDLADEPSGVAPSSPADADRESPGHTAAAPPARGAAARSDVVAPRTRAIQVHNTYLVVETDEGLMIIDQHALHERILYEELGRRVTERKLESQRLLMPQLVQVPADRLEVLEEHVELLERLGLELTVAGPQRVAIQAFPTLLLDRAAPERFVSDLLDLLAERGTQPDTESLVHDLLDMMACKAAVKAGDPLTPEEIEALLERRALAERSSHCPHGRPTTLRMSVRDLERQFHRR